LLTKAKEAKVKIRQVMRRSYHLVQSISSVEPISNRINGERIEAVEVALKASNGIHEAWYIMALVTGRNSITIMTIVIAGYDIPRR